MIGQTISHYKVLEKLGEGGMGIVYKARDLTLDRDVALKFLPHDLTASDEERARFIHEAKSASALDHPNICTIYEVGETSNGQMFIAMGFYEGESLTKKLQRGRLKVEEAVGIAIQVAEGLQAAHNREIVHRDIKSGNIIVTKEGQVKILDFGLAHKSGLSKLTRTGTTVGTAPYMSPEQARGDRVDHRSDLWSLGVVLYEMVTGKLPFRGDHEAAILYSVVNEQPQPIEVALSDASHELIHVIGRALEKDVGERYQSASDMLIDLRRLKRETSRTGFKPVGIPTARSSHEKVRLFALLGAVTIAVAAIVFLLFFSKRSISINPNWKQRPLQIALTNLGYPGISGDGDWIAFQGRDSKGKLGLYTMNTIRGGPRLVTPLPEPAGAYVDVSPDGSLATYAKFDARTNRIDLHIVDMNGGTPQKIVQGGGFGAHFRPDGKRVGYILGVYPSIPPSTSGKLEFWTVNIDGSDPRREFIDSLSRLDGSFCFSYSPDGGKIAWLRNFEGQYVEIIVHDIASGREKQVTFDKKLINEIVWIRGDQILYTSTRDGIANISMVPADGGIPVQITKGTVQATGIRASVDGNRIAYLLEEEIPEFWLVNVSDNRPSQMTSAEENVYFPQLSPSGKEIAFTVGELGDSPPYVGVSFSPRHLVVMDRDGSNRKQLTFGDEVVWMIKWSPDGNRLAYCSRKVSEPVDSFRTYILEPSNPSPRFITDGVPNSWLDSGRISVGRDLATYIVPIDGEPPTRVYDDSTQGIVIQGGKYFVYHDRHKGRNPGVWLVDLTKPPDVQRKSARLLPWGSTNIKMSGDGKTLFSHRPPIEIWRMSLPDGKEERIKADFLGVANFYDFYPNWDGKEIMIIKRRVSQKIVMIDDLFD